MFYSTNSTQIVVHAEENQNADHYNSKNDFTTADDALDVGIKKKH
jgi:hypothetical protein